MWRIIAVCFLFSACTGESLHGNIIDPSRYRREEYQQQVPVEHINYRPYNEVPERIKRLLHLQQNTEPLIHLPPQPALQLQAASAPGVHRTPAPQRYQLEQVPFQQVQPQQHQPQQFQPQQYQIQQYQPHPQPQSQYQAQQYQPQHYQPQRPLPHQQYQQQQQPQPQLIQPAPYNPKVQYNQAPAQPNYKGIQAIQAGLQPHPQPGPSLAAQNYYNAQYKPEYRPVYKPQYNQLHQQQQPLPNALPNGLYRPLAGPHPQYRSAPIGQFPDNLPPHIQKIIESQRAYQG